MRFRFSYGTFLLDKIVYTKDVEMTCLRNSLRRKTVVFPDYFSAGIQCRLVSLTMAVFEGGLYIFVGVTTVTLFERNVIVKRKREREDFGLVMGTNISYAIVSQLRERV